jgi:FkbM family methyltransferase
MLKHIVRSAIRSLGYDLKRYQPASSDSAQLKAMLSAHGINLVLDVGANVGQFGTMLRELGYRGRIVSFEPLSAERGQLLKAVEGDPLWEVAPQAAIGDEDGEIDIHVAANSQSSSALDMLDAHSVVAPESRYVGSERVSLRRLDDLAPGYLRQDSIAFLKIDTQGYEDRVLKGAGVTLAKSSGLQLELSLVPLYEGQRLFDELSERVKASGFELWSVSPVLVDPQTGRLLQVDATFFRR